MSPISQASLMIKKLAPVSINPLKKDINYVMLYIPCPESKVKLS